MFLHMPFTEVKFLLHLLRSFRSGN